MKNIFKRKAKVEKIRGLNSAKEMRTNVENYYATEENKRTEKTRNYIDEKIAPTIRAYSRCGMSNLTIEQLAPVYNKDLFITILKGKGYSVDEFGEKIEIYW